jgi:hypothetical protein
VGGDVVHVAAQTVKGAAVIFADVGLIARRGVDGAIEAAEETGKNFSEVAKSAAGVPRSLHGALY